MKYYARVGQHEYVIEIDRGKTYVDGELVDVDLRQSGASELYSLLFNGLSYELLIQSARFDYGVTSRGERFDVQVEDERTRKLNAGRKAPSLPEGELAVTAPIPGLVVKVLAETGDSVEEEQPLVILEAMKMENALAAPASGTVQAINFGSGDSVAKGDVLCVIG